MKKQLLGLCLLLLSQLSYADYYDVIISSADRDTYYVDSWSDVHEYWEIKTDDCYEYADVDDAILSYSWTDYNHALYFSNGYSCDVIEILDTKVYD
ncbi:MAG: hypothetical protein QM504_05640 [Pseudomonadota bacterium]